MTWILGVKLIVLYDMKNAVAHTYIPFSKIKLFFFQRVESMLSRMRSREAVTQQPRAAESQNGGLVYNLSDLGKTLLHSLCKARAHQRKTCTVGNQHLSNNALRQLG